MRLRLPDYVGVGTGHCTRCAADTVKGYEFTVFQLGHAVLVMTCLDCGERIEIDTGETADEE